MTFTYSSTFYHFIRNEFLFAYFPFDLLLEARIVQQTLVIGAQVEVT